MSGQNQFEKRDFPLSVTSSGTSIQQSVLRKHADGLWSRQFIFPKVSAMGNMNTDSTPTTMDKLQQHRPKVYDLDKEVQDYLCKQTGRDRLNEMFSYESGQPLHPHLDYVVQSCGLVGASVFCVTSVFGSRLARERFIEKHKHTKWETRFRAARAYQDALFLGGAKFGAKWGFKCFAFTGIFLLITQTISVYRNKTSILEYIVAAGLTGATYRSTLGIKGAVAGGIIGSVLGLIGGSCSTILLKTANETQEQRHYRSVYKILREKRDQAELLNSGSSEAETS